VCATTVFCKHLLIPGLAGLFLCVLDICHVENEEIEIGQQQKRIKYCNITHLHWSIVSLI